MTLEINRIIKIRDNLIRSQKLIAFKSSLESFIFIIICELQSLHTTHVAKCQMALRTCVSFANIINLCIVILLSINAIQPTNDVKFFSAISIDKDSLKH